MRLAWFLEKLYGRDSGLPSTKYIIPEVGVGWGRYKLLGKALIQGRQIPSVTELTILCVEAHGGGGRVAER